MGVHLRDMPCARRMGIKHVPRGFVAFLHSGLGLLVARPAAGKRFLNARKHLVGHLISTRFRKVVHEARNKISGAVACVVQKSFKVRRNQDIHRRRNGLEELAIAVIHALGKEIGEHVVAVARHNELANGKAHALRKIPSKHIAEIAGGNAELDGVAACDLARTNELGIRIEVIHDLRGQTADVNGVCA